MAELVNSLHVVYCRGCQHAWHDEGTTLAFDFGPPGECACTCTDTTDPQYEGWVLDPDPEDIPEGAWDG